MKLRPLARSIGLGAALLVGSATLARERTAPEVQAWVSNVIAKIDAADRGRSVPGRRSGAGTVVVRVQIAADGFVNRVEIERSSGVAALDERARSLVRAAGPFGPPPTPLLTPAGTTDLSFPIRLDR
jgi:TonB family protein